MSKEFVKFVVNLNRFSDFFLQCFFFLPLPCRRNFESAKFVAAQRSHHLRELREYISLVRWCSSACPGMGTHTRRKQYLSLCCGINKSFSMCCQHKLHPNTQWVRNRRSYRSYRSSYVQLCGLFVKAGCEPPGFLVMKILSVLLWFWFFTSCRFADSRSRSTPVEWVLEGFLSILSFTRSHTEPMMWMSCGSHCKFAGTKFCRLLQELQDFPKAFFSEMLVALKNQKMPNHTIFCVVN